MQSFQLYCFAKYLWEEYDMCAESAASLKAIYVSVQLSQMSNIAIYIFAQTIWY